MNCPHCHDLGFDASGMRCFCQVPTRVAKVKRRTHDKDPLPASPSRAYLRYLAKWMLIALGVILIAAMWLALIAAVQRWAPRERIVDCSLAEFHPDYSPAVREDCRKKAMRKL